MFWKKCHFKVKICVICDQGSACDFLRSCWQEFVFVGQSLPAAKSVWEVGATEADWELRATSTPTSTIHHLPPSPSLNAIFLGIFQDIFKGCFHPHLHNQPLPSLLPNLIFFQNSIYACTLLDFKSFC